MQYKIKSFINKHIIIASSIVIAWILLPELVFAAGFDIDAGVKAATDPLIKAVEDHSGKGVLLAATTGAVLGESGDLRQKSRFAIIGAVSAAAVIFGLLAMLK